MIGWVRRRAAVFACVLVLVSAVAVGVAGAASSSAASDDEAPLADAGLDQDAVLNETVRLDAGGSRDPDGTIESYEWSIETPSGATTAPDCVDCVRPEFQVTQVGTYDATVTVTDDDGASQSDTMRITVDRVDDPTVELDGPTDVLAGDEHDYTATLEAGDNPLVRVDLYVDGELYDRRSVSGEDAAETVTLDIRAPDTHTIEAQGYDEFGRSNATELDVDVSVPVGSRPCTGAIWNASSGDWDTEYCGGSTSGSDGSGSAGTGSGNGGTSQGEACSRYGGENGTAGSPTADDYYCEHDRIIADGTGGYEIHDADTDGTIEWGGETLDLEELDQMEGVDVNSVGTSIEFESREAYEEATDFERLEPNDDTEESDILDGNSGAVDGDSGDSNRNNDDNSGSQSPCDLAPGLQPPGMNCGGDSANSTPSDDSQGSNSDNDQAGKNENGSSFDAGNTGDSNDTEEDDNLDESDSSGGGSTSPGFIP